MYSKYDDPDYRPTKAERISDRLRELRVRRANLLRDLGAVELEIKALQYELILEDSND